MLLDELFAKLHDANITQPTFLDLLWSSVRGRVDYNRAVLCYKAVKLQQPSYLTCLLSSYRQSRVLRSSTSDLYCQHSLHLPTLLLVGSHAVPPPFGTVFAHLYALLIAKVLGLSSLKLGSKRTWHAGQNRQLKFVCHRVASKQYNKKQQ